MADIDPNKHKKRNALGRGLSALLSNDTPDEEVSKGISQGAGGPVGLIPVDQIETNPFQPRTHFDLVALEELSESIKAQGIIQPITVRSLGKDRYQLISGERRLQASKMAGLKEVPAYIRTANDEEMLAMALIENIQRQDLNPIEVALAYQRLIEELHLKQEELGDKVGKKRATVTNYMRLLKLPPEIQIGLRDGKMGMGHARALLGVEQPERQLAIYREVIAGDLSVRRVEEMVRQAGEGKKNAPAAKTEKRDVHLVRVERDMEEKLGSKVNLDQKEGGKGEIRIRFENTEDLNRILEILGLA